MLCHWEHAPHMIEQVVSQDMMLALVSAGYGVGFIASNQRPSALPDRFVTRLRRHRSDA